MIRIALRNPDDSSNLVARRRRFGLEAPLPADPHVIERAVLRHLAEHHPAVLALAVTRAATPEKGGPHVDVAAGVPDLLLLYPGGRLACLKIKTQAQTLSTAQKAFADLCRGQGIPFHIVRSLSEGRAVFERLKVELSDNG